MFPVQIPNGSRSATRKHFPFLKNLLNVIITKYLKQEVDDDLGVCVDELCGYFRRAPPFPEHLPKKKSIIKLQKKKIKWHFHTCFFLVIQRVRLKHFKWYVRKTKRILEFVNKKKRFRHNCYVPSKHRTLISRMLVEHTNTSS